jgi:hypothetical protein
MKHKGRKSFLFLSLVVISTTNECVSQRDYCYSDEIQPFDSLCPGLYIVASATRSFTPEQRDEKYNAALVACLIELERVQRCESKSSILPGTIGP